VISDDFLEDQEMQEIAHKVGFNETAFVYKSKNADLGIRYFTPGQEMNLCGHATVATLFCLKSRNKLGQVDSLTIETKAGVLPVGIREENGTIKILMGQNPPQFEKFLGSMEDLANVLGISQEDINESMPVIYGNTGNWTLLVPIKKLDTFSHLAPKS
jgi:PhzF family phenazine biosynthesis protein